jgi:class 3 adenylate cyclase
MEHINEYIGRITKLANRNKALNEQLKDLVSRYEGIRDQNDRYQNLLHIYSPEEPEHVSIGKRNWRRYRMVSLLYVTIRGFNKLSHHPQATEMVDLLDEIHMQLNNIARKHHCVSIKTIGDSFLFAAGISRENRTNPIEVLLAAAEMVAATHNSSMELNAGKPFWEISVGVHTGPVTAEPTGKRNNPYNLIGESVNIAYRLGRVCDPGIINMSVMTHEMTKEFFEMSQWGQLPVKYKGSIDIYHLKGIHPELSIDGDGIQPNAAFKTQYGHLQFMEIQEALLDKLEQHLPKNLYYHSVKHTIDVVTEVELIGWAERLSEEELLMLKLAGLFHDSGHVVSYQNHEFHGTQLAREILEDYHFSEEQITTICRLIMATKLPPVPKDKLEEVMCDSDLDYLGRTDFIPVSDTLFQELYERNMIDSYDNWNRMQLNFIKKHQYFTETARNLREVNKQAQIERLRQLLHHDSDTVQQHI